MSIITDYQISFGIKKIHNTDFKFISSIRPSLNAILFEFRSITSCDDLLTAIDLRLAASPQSDDFFIPTQGLQMIRISYSETKFYHDVDKYDANPNIVPGDILPTADFKEIVKAWRNFVANGSGLLT